MKRKFITTLILFAPIMVMAQFHTVKIPKQSPKVTESQTLAVTDITIIYHSPSVKGRDIWNEVVPKNGDPIPWRAGANMNTVIKFSTDVLIEGQPLKAGSYGFHTIPTDNEWTLLFAHHDNQWGSYYLEREKDVALEIAVSPEETNHSEQLDYEFVNRTDSTLQIALEWGTKRVPFQVSVDLNATVIPSMRYELTGINTYQWEAWNDAANWCLNRNTNLEEALEWVNRSIGGGYGGFAANKNITNMSVKSNILYRMGDKEVARKTLEEGVAYASTADDLYGVGMGLLRSDRLDEALNVFDICVKKHPSVWYPFLGHARALSRKGDFKNALKAIDKSISMVPESYKGYLSSQKEKLRKKEQI